jgi:hypothetical protein
MGQALAGSVGPHEQSGAAAGALIKAGHTHALVSNWDDNVRAGFFSRAWTNLQPSDVHGAELRPDIRARGIGLENRTTGAKSYKSELLLTLFSRNLHRNRCRKMPC